MPPALSPLAVLAYLLMFVGLIGSVLPLVPGPLLIWLGALLWAVNDGFLSVGWPTLLFLGILTVIAWSSDLVLTSVFSRRMGASWKAVLGAIVGGLIGGLLLGGWIPIVGTLLATILGAIAGMVAVEALDKRDLRVALRATQGYMVGVLASSLLEATLAIVMILIFAWQAFL
jgi:uncharacterized protein YqgC (DUF456 family)